LRIDSQHSFSERYTLDHLGTILKRNRFEGSVLLTDKPVEAPEFVKAILIRTDHIDTTALDEWQRDPRFRGVCCADVPQGVEELERRNLTLDTGLAAVPIIAALHRRLRIAFAAPAEFQGAAMEAAGRFPNVCGKLAGLFSCSAPGAYVRRALEVFGPSRLMFGSDWPNALPEHTWKESLAIFTQSIGAQSIEVREELLGGTAARFYGI
jgi:L-fuconolactonase